MPRMDVRNQFQFCFCSDIQAKEPNSSALSMNMRIGDRTCLMTDVISAQGVANQTVGQIVRSKALKQARHGSEHFIKCSKASNLNIVGFQIGFKGVQIEIETQPHFKEPRSAILNILQLLNFLASFSVIQFLSDRALDITCVALMLIDSVSTAFCCQIQDWLLEGCSLKNTCSQAAMLLQHLACLWYNKPLYIQQHQKCRSLLNFGSKSIMQPKNFYFGPSNQFHLAFFLHAPRIHPVRSVSAFERPSSSAMRGQL